MTFKVNAKSSSKDVATADIWLCESVKRRCMVQGEKAEADDASRSTAVPNFIVTNQEEQGMVVATSVSKQKQSKNNANDSDKLTRG